LRLTPLCKKLRYLAILQFDLQVCRSDAEPLSAPHLRTRLSLHFSKLTPHLRLSEPLVGPLVLQTKFQLISPMNCVSIQESDLWNPTLCMCADAMCVLLHRPGFSHLLEFLRLLKLIHLQWWLLWMKLHPTHSTKIELIPWQCLA
jgi:hypothetical protein